MYVFFTKSMWLALTLLIYFSVSVQSASAHHAPICDAGLKLHELSTSLAPDGTPRQYRVYVPANAASPMPVVYAFHGATTTPLAWPIEARLIHYADLAGVMIVAPVAIESPNIAGKFSWYAGDVITTTAVDANHYDDTEFIEDLIGVIDTETCTTEERYAFRHSAGSAFSMALACLLPDKFQAVGGSSMSWYDSACETTTEKPPLVSIHNRLDNNQLITDNKPRVHDYANRNGCGAISIVFNAKWLQEAQYNFDCPSGQEVIFYRLSKTTLGIEGHAWPTVWNSEINATDVIFEFFGLL
jgi:poly(3-hydroxybutyrate) depolymerase